jgi:amino acid adenylation domain-containing protein
MVPYYSAPTSAHRTQTIGALEIFAQQVNLYPCRTAVIDGNIHLTYSYLSHETDRLAHRLVNYGLGPGMLAGLFIPRGSRLIIALLAVLKARAAFIFMDIDSPSQRLDFILRDAAVPFVLTCVESPDFNRQAPGYNGKVICLEEAFQARLTTVPGKPNHPPADLSQPAYVIYTSGSTGQSKGVIITYGNLSSFLSSVRAALPMQDDDIYLHSSSFQYALAIRQLFIPLCLGVPLVLAAVQVMLDPLLFFRSVKKRHITLIDLVPSQWRTFNLTLASLKSHTRENLLNNRLRRIVSVGEALTPDIPSQWVIEFKHPALLYNIFGLTESTGMITYHLIKDDDFKQSQPIPIGKPAVHMDIFILDRDLNSVPPGETGHLYISGSNLSPGYLNRPQLTAEKFTGSSLYCTGDLVFVRPDGVICFAGRSDWQVKTRGMRVEPGEIEFTLSQHPCVAECAVIPKTGLDQNIQLHAFLSTCNGQPIDIGALREFLGGKLLACMIPLSFIILETLPKTTSGKIDRIALKLYFTGTPDISQWFYKPRWRPVPTDDVKPSRQPGKNSKPHHTWVIFMDECGLGKSITGLLKKEGITVICVYPGSRWERRGKLDIEMNPRNPGDYQALIEFLAADKHFPDTLLHLWNVNRETVGRSIYESEETIFYHGLYSLFFLIKTMHALAVNNPVQLAIITSHLHDLNIDGEEKIVPAKAAVLGACQSVFLEHPNIHCRSVDIQLPRNRVALKVLANLVIREFRLPRIRSAVAYRSGKRWIREFYGIPHPSLSHSHSPHGLFKPAGVYLVTGGLGKVGLIIAETLARQLKACLILTYRGTQCHTPQIAQKLALIKSLGAELMIAAVDVTHQEQMANLLADISARWGKIDGVIHAAAVIHSPKLMYQHTLKSFKAILAPKVKGTQVLSRLLEPLQPDFLMLFSSISAILGRSGYIAYCAANAYLDAFAHSRTGNIIPTISIDWFSWQDESRNKYIREAIRAEEGMAALMRISRDDAPQIAVSPFYLPARIDEINSFQLSSAPASITLPAPAYPTTQQDIQQTLMEIWKELLQVSKVDLHDDFFQSGGYSLLAIHLFNRIEIRLGKRLPVSTLFYASTFEALVNLLIPSGNIPHSTVMVPIQPLGSKPPLFLMHYYDGSVLYYRELTSYMSPDQPVFGIQAREDAHGLIDLEKVARLYCQEIRTLLPEGPYFIGGHSYGGQVAFEVAKQLSERNNGEVYLILIDTSAPLCKKIHPKKIAIYHLRSLFSKLKFHSFRMLRLPLNQWKFYFKEKQVSFKKHLKVIHASSIKRPRHLNITGRQTTQSETTANRKPFNGEILLLKASIALPVFEKEDYGWKQYNPKRLTVLKIRGEHGNLIKGSYAKTIARGLENYIYNCLQRPTN